MKTIPTSNFPPRLAAATLALAFLSIGSTFTAAADPAGPTPPGASSGNSSAGGSTAARDRHDTVRSNESRLNTVGRGIDPSATKASQGDRDFIEKVAAKERAELRVARLAVERSTDPRIRSFAQQLVSDHEKAISELSALAGRKGVSLAEEASDRELNNLSDKTGLEFDQKFVGHISEEHADDIELFTKASRKSDDPEVAAFAGKRLPVLQDHRRMAQDMEKSLKR